MSRTNADLSANFGEDASGIGLAPAEADRLQAAYETFRRDLPALLPEHLGQWVAYSGNKRLGIGPSRRLLYRACQQAGYQLGEFLVCGIEPPQAAAVHITDVE